jgi:heavy metal efflux system protein
MAQTVAFALLGAFILSLTYIPMMSAFFLSNKIALKKNLSDRIMHRIESGYQLALIKVLHFPKIVIGSVLLLFTAAMFVVTTLGGEFIPALEEGDFAVDTRVLTGSNLNTTMQSTQQAAYVLKSQFPEVVKVVTKIGSGEVPTDPMPMEAADMMVILKDKSEWTSAKSFPELSEKMSTALQDVPGITAGFQFPVQMRFNELMTGARQDVVCKIFGENLDTLSATADKLAKLIATVKGAENLFVEPITGMPQIIIEYNRPLIAQYQLSIVDINKIVNTAFAGQSTGLVYEDEKRFDLVVRLANNERASVKDVQNLLIPLPNGNQIPLYQLATVQIKDGPNQIQREDAKRRIVVGFNVKGRDVQSIVQELQTKVESSVVFPTGYFVTYGGAFENLLEAKKRLLIAVPVSLLLIFVLLYFAFTSIKQGLLIFTAIPLSAIGGIFFLALRGMPFSISAGIGFIALFGVAVLNGIVLITEFNYLKNQGMKNLLKIVLTGTMHRLRPVLMTAFVASLGFLPMALSNGAGAEVQRPLATVVIGGLLMATFLTLFVLPILFIMFNAKTNSPTSKKHFIVLLLCISCIVLPSQAQTPIKLQAAIDTAIKNNLQLKNQQLLATYHQQLINTAKEIPPTNFTSEIGQFNSIYVDTKFGIAQQFNLPVVYKKQQVLLQQHWKQQVIQVGLQQSILKKQVAELYAMLIYLNQKKQLLQYVDTLYSGFYNRSTIRLQKGEDNILEKASAEGKLAEVRLQLLSLEQDVNIAQLQFSLLLNASNTFTPSPQEYIIDSAEKNSIDLSLHPALQFIKQEKQIAAATIEVEKKKLLPSISLGYNNTSIRGTGADDKLYTATNRFNAVQLSVGVPIFIKAQKAKIASANQQVTIAENNYAATTQQLQSDYLTALALFKKQQQQVAYYEQQGLKNAALITTTANEQLKAGNINYLDWIQVIQQAIIIKSNYIEAIKELQFATISVNYFNNK